jgi:hypothetical protein
MSRAPRPRHLLTPVSRFIVTGSAGHDDSPRRPARTSDGDVREATEPAWD